MCINLISFDIFFFFKPCASESENNFASTVIKISGSDKQLVGAVASKIKSFKKIEPYKGKGIKEQGQYILRKEGKKK